jgi:hypothetical protein
MTTFRKPANIELSLVRGDSRTWRFDVTLDGAPINLSAGTVKFQAEDGQGTTIGPIAGSVAGAGNNEVTISFTPTDTAVVGDYDYDIQHASGTDRYTYVEGVLHITQDVNLT